MGRLLGLAAAAAVALAACEGGWVLTGRLAEPPGLEESRAAVARQARAGAEAVWRRNGYREPNAWSETDREVYRNHLRVLREGGDYP